MLKQVNTFQDHAWGWAQQTFGHSFWKYMQHSVSPCFLTFLSPSIHINIFVFCLGSYTLVVKSEGAVSEHQSDVLGVYRMVDSYNDRPVYKQEGGENYIYYR